MTQQSPPLPRPSLHRNVKLLGWASLLNDVASEMIASLLADFPSPNSPALPRV